MIRDEERGEEVEAGADALSVMIGARHHRIGEPFAIERVKMRLERLNQAKIGEFTRVARELEVVPASARA